jgi:chromosome segregation ATPase
MSTSNKNQGEIAKAKAMVDAQRARLQQVRDAIKEKKAEMQELDLRHHKLEATGDINKMMVVKQRSINLGKSITVLAGTEFQCLTRLKSVERYLETLNGKLESLRRESNNLTEKLAGEESSEVRAKVQTLVSRLRMQIEALEGGG